MTDPLWPGMMRRWQPDEGATDGVTVLLVEDDPLVREVMAETLVNGGHSVIVCRNGEECLQTLPTIDNSVVLLTDVALPGCSGRALAYEFRRQRPGAPILFATGLPTDDLPPMHDDEALLLKPFSLRGMLDAVDRMLGVAS